MKSIINKRGSVRTTVVVCLLAITWVSCDGEQRATGPPVGDQPNGEEETTDLDTTYNDSSEPDDISAKPADASETELTDKDAGDTVDQEVTDADSREYSVQLSIAQKSPSAGEQVDFSCEEMPPVENASYSWYVDDQKLDKTGQSISLSFSEAGEFTVSCDADIHGASSVSDSL
jgi:plastocyanin